MFIGKTREKRNKIDKFKLFIGLLLGLFVLIGSQNCGVINPTDDSVNSLEGSGNGEPYTGFQPETGVYYSLVPAFDCPVGQIKLIDADVKSILTVTEGEDEAVLTDNCTHATSKVAVQEVAGTVDSDFVVAEEELLQKLDEPPVRLAPYPVIFCNVIRPNFFRNIEHFIIFDPTTKIFFARTRTLSLDINGNRIREAISIGPVKPYLTSFPAGSAAIGFASANSFNLIVSEKSWSEDEPFYKMGLYQGQLGGEDIKHAAVCLNLKNARRLSIIDGQASDLKPIDALKIDTRITPLRDSQDSRN